jgi:TctA family transporter
MKEFILIGQVVQIIIQLFCAYYAHKLYNLLNNYNKWYYLTLAFILMALRRVTALLDHYGWWFDLGLVDKLILPLTISVLLIIGLVYLYGSATETHENKSKAIQKLKRITKKLEKDGN